MADTAYGALLIAGRARVNPSRGFGPAGSVTRPRALVEGLMPIQPLRGDGRHDSTLVQGPLGQGVLQSLICACDVPRFLDITRKLMTLKYPALRAVKDCGVHSNGKPWVLTELVTRTPLPHELSVSAVLSLGIDLAGALTVLHDAKLVAGHFDAGSVWLGPPALVDLTLAGLASASRTPRDDVRLLTQLLSQLAGTELPASLRVAFEHVATASALQEVLEDQLLRPRSTNESVAAVSREPDLRGRALGPWVLEKLLGEGATGRVYLARHEQLGRRAAVKVLRRDQASNAELVHRFIQESQAVSAIPNEHLVQVYDFGEVTTPEDGQVVFWVMEVLDGQVLSDLLDRSPFPAQRVAHLGAQVARTLAAVHRVGVVHRDVKPENLMLIRKGSDPDFVKVLDFGVAKLLKPLGELVQTSNQLIVGTPGYMAPEQALGEAVDARCDLYALGVVMYELLMGRQPFRADTFDQLVELQTRTQAPRLPERSRFNEPIPAGLATLIHQLLERDPAARAQSGDALADALVEFTAAQ